MPAANTVADFGGGSMSLAFGVVCAPLEARSSGRGQVVDAAIVDGSALLLTIVHALRAAKLWSDTPGTNILDSGAHFYEVYATADGGHWPSARSSPSSTTGCSSCSSWPPTSSRSGIASAGLS